MNIEKKNRKELKAYFIKNAIPTESDFADFIDATLNQKDDGIVKLPGNPLSIEASDDAAGEKKAINFYEDFNDAEPSWVLSLNPRTGFSISTGDGDGDGESKLFIDKETGNVGIGTTEPAARLHITGKADATPEGGGLLVLGALDGKNLVFDDNEIMARKRDDTGTLVTSTLHLQADGGELRVHNNNEDVTTKVVIKEDGKVGIGTVTPSDKLTVADGDVRITGGRYRRLKIVSDSYYAGIELVVREDGENGHPYIDFTHGELDDPNYGVRLLASSNDQLIVGGGSLKVEEGIRIDGNRSSHLDNDGAFYRTGGQVYITVDDNLYIRDKDGTLPFHFQTNTGELTVKRLGIGTTDPAELQEATLTIKEAVSDSRHGLEIINKEATKRVQIWVGSSGAVLDARGKTHLHLRTDSKDRLKILSNGNIGIGTDDDPSDVRITGSLKVEEGLEQEPWIIVDKPGNPEFKDKWETIRIRRTTTRAPISKIPWESFTCAAGRQTARRTT